MFERSGVSGLIFSLAHPMGRGISAVSPFFMCIRAAHRMLTVRIVGEPQWDDAVAVELGCFKERVGEGLVEFVVLHVAYDEGAIARVDVLDLMRVG